MATFPSVLKTGAIAQYPFSRSRGIGTQMVRFLDGSSQAYTINGAGLRKWNVDLSLLDESELSAVIAFAESVGTGQFSFSDPVTGETAAKCVIGGSEVVAVQAGELAGAASLTIEEVK